MSCRRQPSPLPKPRIRALNHPKNLKSEFQSRAQSEGGVDGAGDERIKAEGERLPRPEGRTGEGLRIERPV